MRAAVIVPVIVTIAVFSSNSRPRVGLAWNAVSVKKPEKPSPDRLTVTSVVKLPQRAAEMFGGEAPEGAVEREKLRDQISGFAERLPRPDEV